MKLRKMKAEKSIYKCNTDTQIYTLAHIIYLLVKIELNLKTYTFCEEK